MKRLLSVLLLLPLALPAFAEDAWRVDPDFSKKKARKDISGAACGPERCFAVNDETHYIQQFKLHDGWLEPGERLELLEEKAEIDAEAIAYADGVFYITGSHGLSRKKAKLKPAPFTVFRLRGYIPEASSRLGDAIETAPILKKYAKKPLNENGANIEGIAAVGDTLFFGFRGPSVAGEAVILETSARALFGTGKLPAAIHTIPLGERLGIRDMAAVKDGILLLTGPVNTLPRRYSVALWKPGATALAHLETLPAPNGSKPEGLLVIEEGAETYRILVFFDGAKNGAPMQFVLEKH